MSLLDDLISYWKLDEASGDALDAHGSNDLTDNNTVGTATGKIGNARDFEASNSEYLSRASNASLQTGDIDWTFAAWVWMESKTTSSIAGKWSTSNTPGSGREWRLLYFASPDRYCLFVSSDGGNSTQLNASSFGSPAAGEWHFVVVWHNAVSNSINIQVNNGPVDSASYSSGILAGSGNFEIGRPNGNLQFWNGLIDEVGFWKRVLTSDERTQLYNSGNGLSYDDFAGGGNNELVALESGMLTGGFSVLSGGLA